MIVERSDREVELRRMIGREDRRHHIPQLYYTRRVRDLFVRGYWVSCPHCGLVLGPLPRGLARIMQLVLEAPRAD